MTEAEIVERLWQDSPLFLTLEQFGKSLQGWEIEMVHGESGEVVAVFLIKGPEIHFQKFDHTPAMRKHLRRVASVIEKHGFAVTRTPKDDVRQLRFNAKLGFYIIGEDQYDVHLRIDDIRL